MKKNAFFYAVLFIIFGAATFAVWADASAFRIYYEGREITFNADSGFPRSENEVMLFPLRKTLESVGVGVEYDPLSAGVIAFVTLQV
jgi:hypothetical protein